MLSNVKYIVIHCTDTPDDRKVSAEDVHHWHLKRGWDGIGYHKFIDRAGYWHNGRPDYWVGSHAFGYNQCSIGICLAGRHKFTGMQYQTLESIIRVYKEKYPSAEVVGHYELNKHKSCPNFDVQKWYDSVNW